MVSWFTVSNDSIVLPPRGLMVKNLPASSGGVGHVGLTPASGRSPREWNGNSVWCFVWRTPWTEQPGDYSPWSCKESHMTGHTHIHLSDRTNPQRNIIIKPMLTWTWLSNWTTKKVPLLHENNSETMRLKDHHALVLKFTFKLY